MNKWIALVAAAVVAGGVAFFVLQPKKDEPSADKPKVTGIADVSNQELLAYVPADTVYYFGGINSPEVAQFMRNYKVVGMTPSQTAVWLEVLTVKADEGSKIAKYLLHLVNGLLDNTDGTLSEITQYFGTDSSGSFAIYSHGIVPVLRLPVVDAKLFYRRLDEATQDSGVPFSESKLDDVSVKYWTLTDANAQVPVKLAIAEMDNMLVLSFVSEKDDQALVKERLGIVKPAQSLASSGEISRLKQEYNYSEDMIFLVNFLRLAEGFFDPDNNSFGQSLMRYLKPEKAEEFDKKLSAECKADYLSMVAKMPRLVGGYRNLTVKDKQMDMEMHSVLEIKNSKVINELKKLRGHVSRHTQHSADKMLALGIGLNVDNAVPAMTALWNDFISAEYTCDNLIKAQDRARQTNPAMAGMFLGMVQGLKGVGLSLYKLDMDQQTMQPKQISALFTAAAENPQTLASMAAMIPMLQGISIPDDGTEVDIPLPMLPPEIQLKAAIKGKHLVVYTGDVAKAEVNKIENESIEDNGLLGLSIDYRKLGRAMEEMMAIGNMSDPAAAAKAQSCEMTLEMSEAFASMQFDFSMLSDINDTGAVFTGRGKVDEYNWTDPELVGTFKIAMPDATCQWKEIGVDQLREDGTGSFQQKSDNGACVVYSSNYTWKKIGTRLFIDIKDGKSREDCNAEWVSEEPEQQSCFIFAAKQGGFKCKFNPLSEPATLRYSKM